MRRVQGRCQDMELVEKATRSPYLQSEINGCAFDEEEGVLYVSLRQQRPLLWWRQHFRWLRDIEAWESREKIQEFAQKRGFEYLGTHIEDVKESKTGSILEIQKKLLNGWTLKEVEEDLYTERDLEGLNLLLQQKEKLEKFEDSILNIKDRVRQDYLSKHLTMKY